MGVNQSVYGNIYLETNEAVYDVSQNQTISGRVYLNLKKEFPGKKLQLKFKAQEECSYQMMETEETRDPNGIVQRSSRMKLQKGVNKLYSHCMVLYENEKEEVINFKQCYFDFSFNILAECPSSFSYNANGVTAQIKYWLVAELVPADGRKESKLKYKKEVLIKEKYMEFWKTSSAKELFQWKETPLTSCFCLSKGVSKIKSNQNNIFRFQPGTNFTFMAEVDNSESNIAISNIHYNFKRKINLTP